MTIRACECGHLIIVAGPCMGIRLRLTRFRAAQSFKCKKNLVVAGTRWYSLVVAATRLQWLMVAATRWGWLVAGCWWLVLAGGSWW